MTEKSVSSENSSRRTNKIVSQEIALKNELIKEYAYRLAKSLKSNTDLKRIIKEEAEKKFDGDFDILTSHLEKLELVNSGEKIANCLSNASLAIKSGNFSSENASSDFLTKVNVTIPNLQIAVPIHCETWNPDAYTPLVVYLPYDYDEATVKEVFAYDENGNVHTLNPDIAPNNPVIVVSPSERVDKRGVLKASYIDFERVEIPEISNTAPPFGGGGVVIGGGEMGGGGISYPKFTNDFELKHHPMEAETFLLSWPESCKFKTIQNYDVYNYGIKLPTSSVNKTSTTSCIVYAPKGSLVSLMVRGNPISSNIEKQFPSTMNTVSSAKAYNGNKRLKLTRMKFSESSLTAVEKWLSGAPEIRLRVVSGNATSAVTVFTSGVMEPNTRETILNGWNVNHSIVDWNPEVLGTILAFDWREEDWEDNITFSINAAYEYKKDTHSLKLGLGATIPPNPGRAIIGYSLVCWWHEPICTYDITGFEWVLTYQ